MCLCVCVLVCVVRGSWLSGSVLWWAIRSQTIVYESKGSQHLTWHRPVCVQTMAFFFFFKQFLNECILILPSTHPAFKDPSAVVMLTSFCSYSESENPCVYDSGYILTCVSLVWWIHYQGLSFTPVSLIRYYGKICVHSFGCSSWKNWHLK